MSAPTLSTAPSADDIRAIECPLERASAITAIARRCGTLPTALYALRREALASARKTHSAGAIAHLVGLSRARVFQLTRASEGAPS